MEAEADYGSETPDMMIGKCMWETLQAHIVMVELLRTQFWQHLEVAPHINLYLLNTGPHG